MRRLLPSLGGLSVAAAAGLSRGPSSPFTESRCLPGCLGACTVVVRTASGIVEPPESAIAGGRVGNFDLQPRLPDAEADGKEESQLPSTEFSEEVEMNEDFDELEAASQEVHDLCYGMIAYLRRADPDVTKDLFERRVKKRMREPVPEPRRRLLHGHEDRGVLRRNTFRSDQDLRDATQLYFQLGEKLMLLLTKPVMDRLLESAGKGHRDMRSDGIHKYKKYLERASWRSFPHRWFKHAPFEVQQLRADIPQAAVLNTRFYRDHATVRYLFTLMEPQHPFRSQIEKRMFEITQQYDPVALANQQTKGSTTTPKL